MNVIPYVVAIAIGVLAIRWLAVWAKNRALDAEFERRIRERQDLHRR